MDEQKIPSRSERHKKKKGGFFVKSQKDEPISQAEMESTPEKREFSGDEWYFTDIAVEEEPAVEKQNISDENEGESDEAVEQYVKPAAHKKKKNLNPAVGFLLLFVMLVSGAWCGYAAVNTFLLPSHGQNDGDADQEMLDNINILVLGCDEREGDSAARADVIMVATIRPEAKEVSVFSIPRDTRVEIKGHNQDKINHAMAYGGIPLIQDSVETLLNIKIDHYVKVNFDGFINVIDALGGVNIEVPCRMYKPLEAIDLLPGYQTLSGSEALAFVRWRGDGTGDYGRIERQQQFLTAVTGKVRDMNIKQALGVASAVMDSIETDMSIKQMTSYGVNLLGIDAEAIHTYSFVGSELWLHGVNYVEPDMNAIAEIVDKMQHGEPEPVEDAGGENGEIPAEAEEPAA